ncbi:rCG53227 [Rattus norvegicus]|uniref:RCG53227 n=1 Tax=Rattus norvegicus TaxID=10116 RepID=A6JMS7_RAT|nr:rCG53227 [Rattus norvegicus]
MFEIIILTTNERVILRLCSENIPGLVLCMRPSVCI